MLNQENAIAMTHVGDLWFDTNRMIVIRAGNKEFCIPECILSARSKVFRDFFKDAGSSLNGQNYRLSERGDHVEYFLRAIYDSGFFEAPPKRCELEHALGILSLSSKYHVDYLKRRALAHIETGFPTSLESWRHSAYKSTFQPVTEYSIPYALTNIPKTLSVLKILNQVGAAWFLPAIFYECCRYDLEDLILNPAWMDGSLDEALKKTIIIGYNKQAQEAKTILRFLHAPPEVECEHPSICLEAKRQYADEAFRSWGMNNPLGIWDEGDWLLLDEMCGACMSAAQAMHAEHCFDLWDRLPGLFDLPSWQQLLDLKDLAML